MHTDRVTESLAGARVIIANHALLLAHREELAAQEPAFRIVCDFQRRQSLPVLSLGGLRQCQQTTQLRLVRDFRQALFQ